jgi:hypothetical protein
VSRSSNICNICRKSADIELSSDFSDEGVFEHLEDEQIFAGVQTSSLEENFVLFFSAKLLPAPEKSKNGDEDDYSGSNEAKPGTAEFIIQVEERRSIKVALF